MVSCSMCHPERSVRWIMNIRSPIEHAHLVCLSNVPKYNRMIFPPRDYLIVCVTWCRTKTQFQFELEAEAVVTFNVIADSLLIKTRIWGYKTHSNQLHVSELLLGELLAQMYQQFTMTQTLCLNIGKTCYTLPNTSWICEQRNYSKSQQVSAVWCNLYPGPRQIILKHTHTI
jgi:hypothetical protein